MQVAVMRRVNPRWKWLNKLITHKATKFNPVIRSVLRKIRPVPPKLSSNPPPSKSATHNPNKTLQPNRLKKKKTSKTSQTTKTSIKNNQKHKSLTEINSD
jgi:hypothetical protein